MGRCFVQACWGHVFIEIDFEGFPANAEEIDYYWPMVIKGDPPSVPWSGRYGGRSSGQQENGQKSKVPIHRNPLAENLQGR